MMTDREQKINEMANLVEAHSCDDVCVYCKYSGLKNCERLHDMETLYNSGYRKMDDVTLKLDLGDRSAEEIKQIAEAFNKAMATEQTLSVAKMNDGLRLSLDAEKEKEVIVKKTLQDVLGFLWGWNNGSLDRVIDAFVQKYGVEVE